MTRRSGSGNYIAQIILGADFAAAMTAGPAIRSRSNPARIGITEVVGGHWYLRRKIRDGKDGEILRKTSKALNRERTMQTIDLKLEAIAQRLVDLKLNDKSRAEVDELVRPIIEDLDDETREAVLARAAEIMREGVTQVDFLFRLTAVHTRPSDFATDSTSAPQL
jgi:hypothetical protein